MHPDAAGPVAGRIERPANPGEDANHSCVVDWFALTDSNLPDVRVEPDRPPALAAADPRPAMAALSIAAAWRALRATARRFAAGREICRRRAEAMRRLFPKLASWQAGRPRQLPVVEVDRYLRQAADLPELERRIGEVERCGTAAGTPQ